MSAIILLLAVGFSFVILCCILFTMSYLASKK